MDGPRDPGKVNRSLASWIGAIAGPIGAIAGLIGAVTGIVALGGLFVFDWSERRATPEAQVIVTPELRVAQVERSGGGILRSSHSPNPMPSSVLMYRQGASGQCT